MKRHLILFVIFTCVSLTLSAHGFYLDFGPGAGKAWTTINGYDVAKTFKIDETTLNDMPAIDLSFRVGGGPIGYAPVYIIGEIEGMVQRFSNDHNFFLFNTYMIGPGIIVYPIPLLQLGFSAGLSFTSNKSNIPNDNTFQSQGGVAFNVTAAVDIGKRNHGCLIGVKYFCAYNILETSNAEEINSMVCGFIKYALHTGKGRFHYK